MKKQKALTTAEVFYIQEKSKAGCSGEDISKDLSLKLTDILPYMIVPTTASEAKVEETLTSQSYARHQRGGVVVATEASSQLGDNRIVPGKPRSTDCISPTKKTKVNS